ncbi:DUF6055 domain-containing protein [Prevotella cerevisiae]|uniref:DUF6055 domain-containing protein n=1 Tax=Segatella cerevisiae TaxID=2053716 RepID=A0ABT1BZ08_9BACT|nr:DUF6055 domain-containing protein [Segatella cerevisiae]MCO6026316.1 DUF6055 domain-containing protein [Segatella cerevisiae]
MKRITIICFRSVLAALLVLPFAACSDDIVVGNITIAKDELNKIIDWDETESSVSFTTDASWIATVSDVTTHAAGIKLSWLTQTITSGDAGDAKMPFVVTKNDNESYREALITITSGGVSSVITVHQNANPNAVKIKSPSEIPNYSKYYLPAATNEGFEKGAQGMLRSDNRWSWWRMKQSDHFFVFWEPGFGEDPNADSIPKALRVNIDDLLNKAEQFYNTNITRLGMATVGQGKSQLDNYKMEIYLLYQTDWLATGSGYDNVIGALWVNPSTCQPVGSTIGHEIGHSFQYQVFADKLYTGEAAIGSGGILPAGFRYGFGENGAGGCTFWEQCAQWQSFQDYPQEAFTQDANVQVWLKNHHRHFNHEWQRYASYWFPYYYTEKHGITAYSRIWKESKYPEDPVQTYMRLYCNNNLNSLYKDMYDYSAHCANYDFTAIHQYVTDAALNYSTELFKSNDYYQVSYSNCPGTTGFNLIPLNVPDAGTKVTATIKGIAPGSALASGDPGTVVDGDGKTKGTVTHYNTQTNNSENFRYGYVAIAGDKCYYSDMTSGKEGTCSYVIPAGTTKLYFCIMGAPDIYNRHAWDDDETNDEQWPYWVKFINTDLLGNMNIPSGTPESIELSHTVSCEFGSSNYVQGTLDLLSNGDMGRIAKAFKLQPSEIASVTLAPGSVPLSGPSEGHIAVALTNPDGSLSYAYSANGLGFWVAADGSASSWGKAPVYFEYNPRTYSLAYGHKPGSSVQNTTYSMRPTLVYNHKGKLYKAVLSLKMKF